MEVVLQVCKHVNHSNNSNSSYYTSDSCYNILYEHEYFSQIHFKGMCCQNSLPKLQLCAVI